MLKIEISKEALWTLERMPKNVAGRIRAKIGHLASDPGSLANNVKAMAGLPGRFRLRVGDWRVIFTDNGEILAVLKIAPRGSVYD